MDDLFLEIFVKLFVNSALRSQLLNLLLQPIKILVDQPMKLNYPYAAFYQLRFLIELYGYTKILTI